MRKHIKELLGLQGVWIDSWEITEQAVRVKIRSPRTIALCARCGKMSKKVHQRHHREIKHSVWQSRLVVLHVTKRRFMCKQCSKPFGEYIPGLDRKRSTNNYRRVLIKDLSRNSFSHLMQTSKTSSSVLYAALHEQQRFCQDINWEEQGNNLTIGIDEHSFRGHRMALTLTNITEKRLLALGASDNIKLVRQYLEKADKSKVSEVCMDMKAGFLYAVKECLPDAKVTVDKFHVIAAANKALDEVRSVVVGKQMHIRKVLFKGKERLNEKEKLKLKGIFYRFRHFPSLYEAYMIKEKLRSFYKSKNTVEAEQKLNDIIMLCECSRSTYVKIFGKTLKQWQPYILNYFNHHSTNAFTEGVHTKIKMIKRISFGFRNIHNYIAKVTLAFLPFLYLFHHTN